MLAAYTGVPSQPQMHLGNWPQPVPVVSREEDILSSQSCLNPWPSHREPLLLWPDMESGVALPEARGIHSSSFSVRPTGLMVSSTHLGSETQAGELISFPGQLSTSDAQSQF